MTEISTPKNDLADSLAYYSRKEQKQILKAARCIQKYEKLVSEKLSPEEEADKTIKELEKED